jgi:hypothetical protein
MNLEELKKYEWDSSLLECKSLASFCYL